MQHFSSMTVGEISLVADKNHKSLLVIVESADDPNVYDTDEMPGPANIFDNLYNKWNEQLEVGGVNLAVFSYENRFIRDNTPETVMARIDKDVSRLVKKMGVLSKRVGVIVCSSEITRNVFKDGYDYVNVLAQNASIGLKSAITKKSSEPQPFPCRLPINSKFAYTNSVPAWLWTKTGSVKDDGAGVNLLGFVVRAASVVLHKVTEGSIRAKMMAYHAGQYGKLKLVSTIKQFDTMMRDLKAKKYNSIDTETDNLNRVYGNTMLAAQFCTADGPDDIPTMWVLPVEHSETPWTFKMLKYIKRKLRYYFERYCKWQTHVYQNAKFDLHQWMSFLKIRWYAAQIYDVMAGAFTLEENQKFMKPMGIKPFSLEHIERTNEYDRPPELVIKKADRGKMATFTMKQIADYGVIDVLSPLFLMFEQIAIAKNRGYPRFATFITRQMGAMIYVMTEMEHNGIQVDYQYLKEIASPIGPLAQMIREAAIALQNSPAGKKANKELVAKSSFQKRGLFGQAQEPQLWSIRDANHLALMFFDILGLQPILLKKGGETSMDGKLDKLFQKEYRHTPEVKQFTTYKKLMTLMSSFAKAIFKYLTTNADMMHDHRLRPIFGFMDVLTGRSNTTKPSTQQIPQHGPDAKIIKKQFKVKKGRVLLKSDYGAHEVRVSGNLTSDPAICGAVDAVNKAFMEYRLATTPEEIERTRNNLVDIHCANYEVFFGIKIAKSDGRRQDAKAAVFAVTYGSMAKAIGEKMLIEALYALEDKLVKEKDTLSAKDAAVIAKQIRYMRSETAKEEFLQKAKDLLEVLFDKWSVLTKFIKKEQAKAATHNVVFGPHGRPRHLWGYLHFDKFVSFAMNRRVFNSEGQGYASDYGFTGIYLAKKARWDLFESRGLTFDAMQTNAVHDSSFNDVAFRFLPLAVYIQEHGMISLTEQYYKKYFGITAKAQYGWDMEIGLSEADVKSWNGRSESDADKGNGMIDIIKRTGLETGASEQEIADALHDWKIIAKLRLEELHSDNPWDMTLSKKHIYDRIVPRLRCFADQFAAKQGKKIVKSKATNVVVLKPKKKVVATTPTIRIKKQWIITKQAA